MTAGLPGSGIGGLFYIVCALLMPFIEFGQTLRGRSNPERWKNVARHSGLAWAIVVVVERSVWFVRIGLERLTASPAGDVAEVVADSAQGPQVAPFIVTAACLTGILLGAIVLRLALARKTAGRVVPSAELAVQLSDL